MDLFDQYEIVGREHGTGFEFRRKSDGEVMLFTEYVSLSTLIRLALEDELDAT
jgi:hypothetical protein